MSLDVLGRVFVMTRILSSRIHQVSLLVVGWLVLTRLPLVVDVFFFLWISDDFGVFDKVFFFQGLVSHM